MLTNKHARDVCLAYMGGKQCRYLQIAGGYQCLKLTKHKDRIDLDVAKLRKNSLSNNLLVAKGNNCKGYLYLKHKKQSYDIKGS